jgi:hypothetical protein
MNSLAMHHTVTLMQQEAHRPPDAPFTTEQAHAVMQFHVVCRVSKCPQKAAAYNTLVEAGKIVPDPDLTW